MNHIAMFQTILLLSNRTLIIFEQFFNVSYVNNMRIIIIFLMVAITFANSCSNKTAGKKVADVPVELKIHLTDNKDSVQIFVYIESEKIELDDNNFLNNIINITGQLIHRDIDNNNNVETNEIQFSKQQIRTWKTKNNQYVTFALSGKAHGIGNITLNDCSIKILFEANNEFYAIERPCSQIFEQQQYLSGKGLIVVPYFEKSEGQSGVFGMFAYRINQIEEYLPSSEDFRIEIVSQKGKTAFNSHKGQAFLTVIKEVNPQRVGSMYEYSYPWFGKSDGGYILLEGDYSARLFIPAVPNPYGKIINFYWENDER